ncbi:2OG-Fe(II) oxygenase [Streptomyces sp. NPDC056661]|uniref:2OG-Fe(II) oxygenase n=1 Tax=Streptomyces sp. NPDC056661 TaxID=3345898 RepID=UPI0036758DD8
MSISLHNQIPNVVRAASMSSVPWAHAYLPGTLPIDFATHIAHSFDDIALTRCEQTEYEKSYRFGTAELGPGGVQPAGGEWSSLVDSLSGAEYRDALSELTSLDLANAKCTLSLWEYYTGDWLAPHVDKAEKLVTQIFYLTPDWQEGDAGRLLILERSEITSVVHALPPRLGASAILVRSESSWHAVEPPSKPGGKRRSITATFWR